MHEPYPSGLGGVRVGGAGKTTLVPGIHRKMVFAALGADTRRLPGDEGPGRGAEACA